GAQAGISQERVESFQPLGGSSSGPAGGPSSRLELPFAFVALAFAESPAAAAQQTPRFDPGIQITRPRFVLVLKRATSQEEALRLAKELQKEIPTAQAVKTDQGFFVVDSVTSRSEADALLDALQLKSQKKLNP